MGSVFIDVAQTSSEVVEAHQKKEEGAGASGHVYLSQRRRPGKQCASSSKLMPNDVWKKS